MPHFAFIVAAGVAIAAFVTIKQQERKSKGPAVVFDQIILFGDSITQQSFQYGGLGSQMANAYQRKLDVLNRGLSGYNTLWAIPIAKQFFPQGSTSHTPKIRLMLIWFGANDSAIAPSPQGISIEQFKENLHIIMKLITDPKSPHYSPLTKFLLITPPPVDALTRNSELTSRNPPRVPDRDAGRTKLFAEAVLEVGKEANVPCVDVWTAIDLAAQRDGLDKYLSDGLHLSREGYELVTAEVARVIESDLAELHWDRLPRNFPDWGQVINEGALGEQFRDLREVKP